MRTTDSERVLITSANTRLVFACFFPTLDGENIEGSSVCPETSRLPYTASDAPSLGVRILNEWIALFIYKWSANKTHTNKPPHLNILCKYSPLWSSGPHWERVFILIRESLLLADRAMKYMYVYQCAHIHSSINILQSVFSDTCGSRPTSQGSR